MSRYIIKAMYLKKVKMSYNLEQRKYFKKIVYLKTLKSSLILESFEKYETNFIIFFLNYVVYLLVDVVIVYYCLCPQTNVILDVFLVDQIYK